VQVIWWYCAVAHFRGNTDEEFHGLSFRMNSGCCLSSWHSDINNINHRPLNVINIPSNLEPCHL